MSPVRLASSPLALRILSPLFMSPQVGPWEQAEQGPVSIWNTGRHNGLCLQLHCWQTPTQRGWKGSPSVLTHTEEWVSVLPLRAVFVQYIQLLSMATVLPSMGAEVLMKTRRKGLLCGCQQEFMFIRWALCLLDGTCMYAEKRRVTEQQVIGLLDRWTTFHDILQPSLFNYHIITDCRRIEWIIHTFRPWNQIFTLLFKNFPYCIHRFQFLWFYVDT